MAERFAAGAFFDWAGWDHAPLFAGPGPVWGALERLDGYLAERCAGRGRPAVPAGVWLEGDVVVGEGVLFEPGVCIKGPAILGDGAVLRHGAYLRGGVIVGEGAIVGHATEVKHAVLLPGASASHFNYVGDSLLGRWVNLGAGTVLSNVRLDRATVPVWDGESRVDTGLAKFGAVLGDGSQTGCQVVLNPGTLASPGVAFFPGVCAAGWYPAGAVVRGAVAHSGEPPR